MLTTAQVQRLAEATADKPDLPELAAIAAEACGAELVTLNRFDAPVMEVERVFSSDPERYPVGGRKRKAGTEWGEHVLVRRRVFVGEGEAALKTAFDDHAVLLGLGLRSVVNVPVSWQGECVGTFNLLARQDTMPAEGVAVARVLARLALPALLPPGRP